MACCVAHPNEIDDLQRAFRDAGCLTPHASRDVQSRPVFPMPSNDDDFRLIEMKLAMWGERLRAGCTGEDSASSSSSSAPQDAPTAEMQRRPHIGLAIPAEQQPRSMPQAQPRSTPPWSPQPPKAHRSCQSPADLAVLVALLSGRQPRDISRPVLVRGSLAVLGEPVGTPAVVRSALRCALLDVIGSAACPQMTVSVSAGQRVRLVQETQMCVKYAFEVGMVDPNDRAPLVAALELEAQCAGARKLLPCLAKDLTWAGRLSVRLELL